MFPGLFSNTSFPFGHSVQEVNKGDELTHAVPEQFTELISEVRHNSHGDLNTEFSFRILQVCHYIINSYVDHHQK